MDNIQIALSFQLLAQLMEFHQENPYKIRSYQNAYGTLRKWDQSFSEMDQQAILAIPGVGEAISNKIRELVESGQMKTLEKYKKMTPPGIVELLKVRGLGPKKIRQLHQELGIESIGDLYYACVENRLVKLKGFGEKTQKDIIDKLDHHQSNAKYFLIHKAQKATGELIQELNLLNPDHQFYPAGDVRRMEMVVDLIEILSTSAMNLTSDKQASNIQITESNAQIIHGIFKNKYPFELQIVPPETLGNVLMETTASIAFMESIPSISKKYPSEEDLFVDINLPWISPECRELPYGAIDYDQLIDGSSIKGLIHCHSTYSDGIQSIEEMANEARILGYSYLGMTDHSKMAFYAQGLDEERLTQQWQEIDSLNDKGNHIPILKGIECDILTNGDLDYDQSIRASFDFIIASIHSHLKMDEEKATDRIIKAIENPQTNILGHPSGRIFLAREGYPLNMEKVIDACADNQVAIELNANPHRLDIDWHWIQKAMYRGVMISINPDAHNLKGMKDLQYGVSMARKGGLIGKYCLNSLSLEGFLDFCTK